MAFPVVDNESNSFDFSGLNVGKQKMSGSGIHASPEAVLDRTHSASTL